ncbi:PHD finger protein EHD3-like [Typha angustifolia]|uniref:PHD finger protein EHD3-like n=1 Tax=Typha angustifolia TaxID=59011 RepID=UPI003C2CF9A7
MSVEERKCNGLVKLEDSSLDGFITYKRRKHTQPSTDVVEGVSNSSRKKKDGDIVWEHGVMVDGNRNSSRKKRDRDIGWNHGVMVDGNRLHWQCNWCGLIRYGGGVSRLKRHLAGTKDVRKCPNVPEDVSRTILDHLMMKQRCKRKKSATSDGLISMKSRCSADDVLFNKDHLFVDLEMKVGNAIRCGQWKIDHHLPNNSTQQSHSPTWLDNNIMEKQGEVYDIGLNKDNYVKDKYARTDSHWRHWRHVLENILQLPDVSEGAGIQSCILDALAYGPSGLTTKLKTADVCTDTEKPPDRYEGCSELKMQSERPDSSMPAASHVSKTGKEADTNVNTTKCQKTFVEILRSEKFVFLCDLLFRTFEDNKTKRYFDFSLINSKMSNGDYELSPGSFDLDIQQIWEKFQKVGRDMVCLARSLSNLSKASYLKQVEVLEQGACENKPEEETCVVGVEQKNSVESYVTQFTSCVSDHSNRPDQTEASGLYKICTCKQCGAEANGERSLICDGCEAIYHFSCVTPTIKAIPTQSWYCATCSSYRRDSPEAALTHTQVDSLHQNCAVCDRLEVSETLEHNESGNRSALGNDSRESSVSNMESDEPPEMSRTVTSHLCKICRTREEEDKRFLVCGHIHCPYKFYHIRCLRSSQIASAAQQSKPCWYCPSCLCRGCLSDKDDDEIVLCDSCDEAYHTYCMKPPRSSIPVGKWYCFTCNVARAREGLRKYEQWILQQHRKNDLREENVTNRSMDLLLSAAEKLKSEEHISDQSGERVNHISTSANLLL